MKSKAKNGKRILITKPRRTKEMVEKSAARMGVMA